MKKSQKRIEKTSKSKEKAALKYVDGVHIGMGIEHHIADLPIDWVVYEVNLDDEKPYLMAFKDLVGMDLEMFLIPKNLAYYLTTHFCGSKKMHEAIVTQTRVEIGHSFQKILGMIE